MKKLLLTILILLSALTYANVSSWRLMSDGYRQGTTYQNILYLRVKTDNNNNVIWQIQDNNTLHNITKSQLHNILYLSKNNLYVSLENILNNNFSNPYKNLELGSAYWITNIDTLLHGLWYMGDFDESTVYDELYKDEEIGLANVLGFDGKNILYDESDIDSRWPIGYYNDETGEFYSTLVQNGYDQDTHYDNGTIIEYENENNKSILTNAKLSTKGQLNKSIEKIISLQDLIQGFYIKFAEFLAVIIGGYVCFLVVKTGLKWQKEYLGYSPKDNDKYEIAPNTYVDTLSQKYSNVIKDENGDWYDMIHEETYRGNLTNEDYEEIRYANLYFMYQRKFPIKYANTSVKMLEFNQFRKELEQRNVNIAIVDDESITDELIKNTELQQKPQQTTIKPTSRGKRRYKNRKQYWAIRNYYRKKNLNQSNITQPIIKPVAVPQQKTVRSPDDNIVSTEEYIKLTSDYHKKQLEEVARIESNPYFKPLTEEEKREIESWDDNPFEA